VVANIDELPVGAHKVVNAGGREIGVFNVLGNYYALPNNCFHQNGPLCRGSISGTVEANESTGWKPTWVREGEVVICPWHTLEFDIKTGRCLADPRHRLPTYKVKVIETEIRVTIP
jgi:3-phenylpropionate/trans-cinnamate dioxygenase ferredoxin subunit